MQWEYQTLEIDGYQQEELNRLLKECGEARWELIHYAPVCIFKRPKEPLFEPMTNNAAENGRRITRNMNRLDDMVIDSLKDVLPKEQPCTCHTDNPPICPKHKI
jgi:hypothetical protein